MLFLVWTEGGGVAGKKRNGKPSQHCTAMFLITAHTTESFSACFKQQNVTFSFPLRSHQQLCFSYIKFHEDLMMILAKTKHTLKALSRNKLELWATESVLSAGSRQVFVSRNEKPSPWPEQSLEVISWSQFEAASMEVLFPLAERENRRKRFHWSAFWICSAVCLQRPCCE